MYVLCCVCLTVTEAPRRPLIVLDDVETPLIDGQSITLTCSAGRPSAIRLTWVKQLPGTHTWLRLKNDSVAMTTDNVTDSGTSLLVSRVKLALGASDDGVVYRCLEMSGDVTQASASYTLRVQCKKHFTSLTLTLLFIYLLRCACISSTGR